MRVSFRQTDAKSWEIELDGLSISTWEIYSDSDQAETDYEKLSREQIDAMQNMYANPSPAPALFVCTGFGKRRNGYGEPTIIHVERNYFNVADAKRGYDQLIAEKLSEGYVQTGESIGAKEKKEQLLEAMDTSRELQRLPNCFSELKRDKAVDCNGQLTNVAKKVFGIPLVIGDNDKAFNPIQSISYLGRGGTHLYWQCHNTPEHHVQNAADDDDNPQAWFERVGYYYGFDFVAAGPDGVRLPLRVLINAGDADCNDGIWGEVWHRETAERVANITSTGDCESTIEVVSSAEMFESQEIPVLMMQREGDFDLDDDDFIEYDDEVEEFRKDGGFYLSVSSMTYENELKLERLIGLAIKIFSAYIHVAYKK